MNARKKELINERDEKFVYKKRKNENEFEIQIEITRKCGNFKRERSKI
jgi:hypothetical protein